MDIIISVGKTGILLVRCYKEEKMTKRKSPFIDKRAV